MNSFTDNNYLYSIRLADHIWKKLVKEFNDTEINKVNSGESYLTEDIISNIISSLNGTLINFSKDIADDNESIKKMYEHLMNKYNVNEIKENSYFVKTDNQSFEIGFLEFDLVDIICSLSQAFLNIENISTGNIIWRERSDYISEGFARTFIMPRERFLKIISKFTENNGKDCNLEKVSKSFSVEFIDVYIRGKDFNLWT